jgi:hypothetical protein
VSSSRSRRLIGLVLTGLLLSSLAAPPVLAERSGRDGVLVIFNAAIAPNHLPRHKLVPVSVSLSGAARSTTGGPPPNLGSIELAFGARGGLDVAGLPTCPRARLRNATNRQALARCRAALVGHGTLVSEVPLAPARPLLARAAVLAFNATVSGRRAVLVHAYSASPPVSFVLPFTVDSLRHGAYGFRLEAPVAQSLGRWPRLRSFQITLGRRFRSQGQPHSYLNARCPLPPRFHSLSIPLARATYRFSPAPIVSTTILRSCRVRD